MRPSIGGRWVHLPPSGTDVHRWINPDAVEWFAAMGTESVMRLRTGDTLRTSLAVTELADRLAAVYRPRPGAPDFEAHDAVPGLWAHDHPEGGFP